MLLTVCLNGARAPEDHSALAADPEALVGDAAAAVDAGADEIHLHPMDSWGHDSLRPEDVDRWLRVFRAHLPGVPIGLATGAWAAGGEAERLAPVRSWRELPDLVSVDWHEAGAEELAGHAVARGIGIEAGLWTVEAAHAWARSPHAEACHRVLVELPDLPAVPEDRTRRAAEEILAAVDDAGHDLPVLLHGKGRSTWPAVLLAHEHGRDTRIGLEDTLTGPDGTAAGSNAELVDRCREVLGREVRSRTEPEDSTSRLTLHRPRRADVPELFAILSDPRVWTHLPSGRHREIGRTAQAVRRWIAEWERDGISTWVVRERGSTQVIGYGGLSSLDGAAWNLGYRFAVPAQGRGLATELARHALERARVEAPELPVIAYLLEHNAASAAVARRVGLELVDRGPDAGNPDPEAVRLVFASRALGPEELAVARR